MGIVFDSCKTALSWVVVWISVVLRRLWLFLSVTGKNEVYNVGFLALIEQKKLMERS